MASYREVPCDEHVSNESPDGAATTSVHGKKVLNHDRKPTPVVVTMSSDGEASQTRSMLMVDRYLAKRSPQTPPIVLRGREVLLAIGVFFLFSVSVGLFVMMVKNTGSNYGGEQCATCARHVCLTEECVEKAAFMMRLMNKSASPCDDFWNYACGGWLASNTIPESHKSWGVGRDVEKRIATIVRKLIEEPIVHNALTSSERKAKTLYRACMNIKAVDRAGNEPLQTIIADVGGWAATGMYRDQ